MKPRNLLYAQSGGVTAVINASAAAVIRAARAAPQISAIYAARNGILGVLEEALFDTASLSDDTLTTIAHTPAGVFGSCRMDLDDPAANPAQFERLLAVLAAHDIGYFLYNGGNGSMDVVAKISRVAREQGYPLVCVGVPKTIDNDLEGTDCSPGFGSTAKYLALSMLEAGLDLRSMASRAGRAFVMETMGRNVGWLAAATALAVEAGGLDPADCAPHIVLLPEVPLDEAALLAEVERTVTRLGYCAVTVSEGIRGQDGRIVTEHARDERGYVQLGGAGQYITNLIQRTFGFKTHWSIPDYLQRAAAHMASATDYAQALAVGEAAVKLAVAGEDGYMAGIRRLNAQPYEWDVVAVACAGVANLERKLPAEFIRADGLHVTQTGRDYLRPFIVGERPMRYHAGLPVYSQPQLPLLRQKLPPYQVA